MTSIPTLVRVGCAGWSLRSEYAEHFPPDGTHLERYAQRFPAVEINSSFYRSHRPETYARWAAAVPTHFQFAVKVPREITHTRRLVDAGDLLEQFLREVQELGPKLGPLLVQLPPSLRFQIRVAETFWATLRALFDGGVVCEPRHASWFTAEAEQMLENVRVARVAADPAPVPEAALAGGWDKLVYYRLHGSPEMYRSSYSESFLETLGNTLDATARSAVTWCIFDNTALGAATGNALQLLHQSRCGDEEAA